MGQGCDLGKPWPGPCPWGSEVGLGVSEVAEVGAPATSMRGGVQGFVPTTSPLAAGASNRTVRTSVNPASRSQSPYSPAV